DLLPESNREINSGEISHLTKRIEDLWLESPGTDEIHISVMWGDLVSQRAAAIDAAKAGNIDVDRFFFGALDIVRGYLSLENCGLHAKTALGRGIHGYVGS